MAFFLKVGEQRDFEKKTNGRYCNEFFYAQGDTIKWYTDKLLSPVESSLLDSLMTKFLRLLSEQELALVRHLTSLEITGRRKESGMISLNHDDENRSLP